MKPYRVHITRGLWFWLTGFAALLWLLLRSGGNPKRFSYPCQQAAAPLAASWLLSVAAFVGGSLLLRRYAQISLPAFVLAGIFWFTATSPDESAATAQRTLALPVWQVPNPVSKVFVMDNVPPTSGSLAAGDSTVPNAFLADPAIDSLLSMMAQEGIHLHKTVSRPTGIVGRDNIVIIKGNFQWTSRNVTSADRIKGLIWRVLRHPDGFTGEIVVCDNTQEIGTGINDNDNNSEDPNQSIIDVINTFRSKGYPVSVLDWNTMWAVVASEYSTGDDNNGYVYEAGSKITYPKFRSPSGRHRISLRYGIWDSAAARYDPARLCIIDFPVLKAHSLAGATIAVKNWIGVLTTAYADSRYGGSSPMHNNYLLGQYALVARVMSATFPKLTIVDAAWTTTQGPSNLQYIQNTKMLLASTDPVAPSWYAAKFILTPIARYPGQTNPDLPGSSYRNTLTNWTTFLRDSAGLPCTKDSTRISVYDRRVLTSIGERHGQTVPKEYVLDQNYPNPFNPTTEIRYQIPEASQVTLKVYDLLGREAATLVSGPRQQGEHSVIFDARDLPSGVYCYQLQAGERVATKKLVLLR